jgi:hypothetical protein
MDARDRSPADLGAVPLVRHRLPSGTVVHLCGVPVALVGVTTVESHERNLEIALNPSEAVAVEPCVSRSMSDWVHQ